MRQASPCRVKPLGAKWERGIVRGLLRLILSGGYGGESPSTALWHPLPELIETDRNRLEPVGIHPHRITPWPIPTRRWATPAEHAAAILDFLQGPGGRTGSLPVDELKKLHVEICAENDWEPIGWTAVGRELRKLLGAQKTYEDIKGRPTRVYRIPPIAGRRRLGRSDAL